MLGYAEAVLAVGLADWAVAAAARLLSLDNLLAMLAAALLEQRIVVFCPDVAACSAVVLSLVPMMRPFGWVAYRLCVRARRSREGALTIPTLRVDMSTDCHGDE